MYQKEDEVIFKVVADAATGIEAFKNGELDAAFSQGVPGGLPYAQMRQLVQGKPENIVITPFNQALTQYLWVNCVQPPFDNVKVRRALAHAINKELIIRTLLQGFGRVQDSIVGDLAGLSWALSRLATKLRALLAFRLTEYGSVTVRSSTRPDTG